MHIDPSTQAFFIKMSETNKKRFLSSDYERTLEKTSKEKRLTKGKNDVPQLGTQKQQAKTLMSQEQIKMAAFLAEAGLTMEQAFYGADIEINQNIRTPFIHGQPLVKQELIKDLPTQMRRFHDFYMRASARGRTMIGVLIRKENYFWPTDVMWLEFKDIYEIYHKEALDLSLVSCWIL